MKKLSWIPVVVACSIASWSQAQDMKARETPEGSFLEKRLSLVPEDLRLSKDSLVFSSDGQVVAYKAQKGNKQQGERQLVVVGEKKGEDFAGVVTPVLSPDGKSVAYAAKTGRKQFVVVGDRKGQEFDKVSTPVFSRNGKTVAYVASERDGSSRSGTQCVIVGDKAGEKFDRVVSDPVFSPDGKIVAYAASKGGKDFVVVGDKKGDSFGKIVDGPVFSPDGKMVAYAVFDHGTQKGFMVIGEKKSEEYDQIEGFAFNAAGRVSYAARNESRHCLVVGDKKGPEVLYPESLSLPVFSPDGSTVVYTALMPDILAFIVVGDKRGEQFKEIGSPVFSRDGKSLAYAARKQEKWCVVVGDAKGEEFDAVGRPVFSSDGKTVAYAAQAGGKHFVVVGGKKSEEVDLIPSGPFAGQFWPVFSPDDRKIAYGALKGRELWWKVFTTP